MDPFFLDNPLGIYLIYISYITYNPLGIYIYVYIYMYIYIYIYVYILYIYFLYYFNIGIISSNLF